MMEDLLVHSVAGLDSKKTCCVGNPGFKSGAELLTHAGEVLGVSGVVVGI